MRRAWWMVPIVVLALSAGALWVWWTQAAEDKQAVFQSLMRKLSAQVEAEFGRIFDPVTTNLSIARQWGEEDLLDTLEPKDLNAGFMAILQQVPQIASVQIADGNGREYMLLRRDDQWQTRQTGIPGEDGRALWNRWEDARTSVEEWWRESDYDPRQRPWFLGAAAADEDAKPFWTNPYTFYATRKPGISAALRWRDPDGSDLPRVIAFDVLLSGIASQTASLPVAAGGTAFVITDNGDVLGLTHPTAATSDKDSTLSALTLDDLTAAGIVDAVAAWDARGRAADDGVAYQSAGQAWWAGFRPYRLGEQKFWLGTALPEAALMDRVGGLTSRGVPLSIIIIGLVGALASVLVLRPRNGETVNATVIAPAASTLDNAITADTLPALIEQGESERLEFKSTVRYNIRAGKTGKEIELAWLKTVAGYLNTDGGTLLFGVDDAGTVVGLNRDGFASDDACLRHIGNLITEHIGAEHAPCTNTRVLTTDAGKVAVIQVRATTQPAFLTAGKDEDFFIRSGPASRKLPPSRILAYLRSRDAS